MRLEGGKEVPKRRKKSEIAHKVLLCPSNSFTSYISNTFEITTYIDEGETKDKLYLVRYGKRDIFEIHQITACTVDQFTTLACFFLPKSLKCIEKLL